MLSPLANDGLTEKVETIRYKNWLTSSLALGLKATALSTLATLLMEIWTHAESASPSLSRMVYSNESTPPYPGEGSYEKLPSLARAKLPPFVLVASKLNIVSTGVVPSGSLSLASTPLAAGTTIPTLVTVA